MLVALLYACNADAPPAAEPAPVAAAAPEAPATLVNLGTSPDEALAVSLDEVLANAGAWEGKSVVVKAGIATVCQKKGCWHRLATANPDVTVMCKDKEYEVFLPLDAAGKTAVVAGVFHQEVLSIEDAKHFAEDAGKDPATVTAPVTQYAIDLVGVKLL